jgi:hypothetical protein
MREIGTKADTARPTADSGMSGFPGILHMPRQVRWRTAVRSTLRTETDHEEYDRNRHRRRDHAVCLH